MRIATCDDAEQIVAIYRPYVLDTTVTFEIVPPTVEEYRRRLESILARYPFIVACDGDGRIIGYCYANTFKPRRAYDWTVESTIYLSPAAKGKGISAQMYGWLEEMLVRQGVTNMCACIAQPNPGSTIFHERLGFLEVARFTQCGFKLGTWLDMIWMEKHIAPHVDAPEPVVAFPDTVHDLKRALDAGGSAPDRLHRSAS